jgi:hypothetical protein
MSSTLDNQPPHHAPLPEVRSLRVTLRRRAVTVSRWTTFSWDIAAVEMLPDGPRGVPDATHPETQVADLELRLYRDQAEEYRHNLGGRVPTLSVICSRGPDDAVEPRTLSVSQTDTASYLETDDVILSCPLPQAVYDWMATWVALVPLPAPRRRQRAAEHGEDG